MQWQDLLPSLRHLNPTERDLVRQAFDLCESAHRGQVRKSGEPYAIHPITVAAILAELGADADTLIAALLHDTVEDTELPLADIRERFGPAVAALIEGLTSLEEEELRERPTLDQEIESLRKIVTVMQEDVRIMVIRLADRLHNMRTIRFLAPARQRSFAQETMDVYVKIAERMGMLDMGEELEELSLSVLDPPLMDRLRTARAENSARGKDIVKRMERTLYAEPFPLPRSVKIQAEPKTWEHLRARLGTEKSAVSGKSDLTVVLLCADVTQCYETFGIIHQQWPREVDSFKDFINTPAINGYRGLHTTVILPDGIRVRCKIRTPEMHAYAHRGMATLCFDRKADGLLQNLTWLERIAPLSRDTRDRSKEFWDSLQMDILGKSILIYGPDNRSVQVPVGATALDGAFYLFKETALRTRSVTINGRDAPLFTPLTDGTVLNIHADTPYTVTREWLSWVRTGVAIAMIRSQLGSDSRQKNIETGMRILQEVMTRQGRGYLKEFREESILSGIRKLGFASKDDMLIAIADGHLGVSEAIATLFGTSATARTPEKKLYAIHFTLPALSFRDIAVRFRFLEEKYDVSLRNVQILPASHERVRITLRLRLSSEEQHSIAAELHALDVTHVRVVPSFSRIGRILAVTTLFILWGLDPVFARLLIHAHILSAYDLTVIRFLTLFTAATIGYGIHSALSTHQYRPLHPFSPLLALSAAALFLTALSTYVTLIYLPPTQYILFIIGGLALPVLLRSRAKRTTWWWRLLLSMISTIAVLMLLILLQGSMPLGLLFAAVSSFGFVLYSHWSSAYQRTSFHARYPAFLFWIGIYSMPLTFLLFPATHILSLPFLSVLTAVGFVAVFSILPYGLYYESMRYIRPSVLDNALPFVLLSTVVGEVLFTQSLLPFIVLPLLLLYLWHYVSIDHSPL